MEEEKTALCLTSTKIKNITPARWPTTIDHGAQQPVTMIRTGAGATVNVRN